MCACENFPSLSLEVGNGPADDDPAVRWPIAGIRGTNTSLWLYFNCLDSYHILGNVWEGAAFSIEATNKIFSPPPPQFLSYSVRMEGSALLVINIDSSPWARSLWTGTFSWGGVSLCRELASKPMVLSCKSPGTEDSFLAWVLPMQTPCSPFFSFKSLRVHIDALGLQVWDLWKKWVLVFCSNIKWPYTWPVCLENAKVLG